MARDRKATQEQIANVDKINQQSIQFAGAPSAKVSTEAEQKKIADINQRFKDAGYDESVADDLADMPTGGTYAYDLKKVLPLKQTNPERYKGYLASIKFQGEIANNIEKEQGKQAAEEAVHFMSNAASATDYNEARMNTRSLVTLAKNDPKIVKNIATARAVAYGANLPGREEAIQNDPRYIGNGGNLNNYQTAAIQFLEDTDPATANMYERLLSVTPGKDLDRSKIGSDMKARELERIGKGIALDATIQQLRDNPNNEYLQKKYEELRSDYLTEASRYPAAAQMDAQRVMQEALGARNGVFKKYLLGVGDDARDVGNWIGDILTSPFKSDSEKALSDLELLGDKEFAQAAQMYQPENEKLIGSDFVVRFSPDLQKQIDAIKAGSGDYEDKAAAVSRLIQQNPDGVSYVPNDKANKANFTAKAIFSNAGSVASQLTSQLALAYLLGGAGNVSKGREFATLFGSTFATTYDDYYSQAIRDNIKNPSTYATVHATIEASSELINNDIEMAKKVVGSKGALGAILDGTTKEVWNSVRKTGFWKTLMDAGLRAAKTGGINAVKESEEEVVGQITQDVIDKYAFNQDSNFTDDVTNTFITTMAAMLPLGLIGLPFKYSEVTRNRKYAMYEIGSRPQDFLNSIDKDVKSGAITMAEAEQRMAMVEWAKKAVGSTMTQKMDGTPLTDNEKTDYAFNQAVLQTIAENQKNVPPAVQEQLQAKKEEIEKKQVAILMPGEVAKNEPREVVGVKGKPVETEEKSVSSSDAGSPENTGETESGTAAEIPERLPQEELGSGDEVHSKEQAASSFIAGRTEAAGEKQQRSLSRHEREDVEKQAAFDYAKENGLWVDDLYSLGQPFKGGGNENTLAYDETNGVIYKANNLFNSQNSISEFLKGIEAHNQIFPGSKYELVGFTGHKTGSVPYVEPIVKQDYVAGAEQATQAEIDAHMKDMGFEKINDHTFRNENYTVSDLRPRNVLKDSEGGIHVIDDIVKTNEGSAKQQPAANKVSGSKETTPAEHKAPVEPDSGGTAQSAGKETGRADRPTDGGESQQPSQPRQDDLTEKEKVAYHSSWGTYQSKFPGATMEEYQQNRVSGYQKEKAKRTSSDSARTRTYDDQAATKNYTGGRIAIDPIKGKKPKDIRKIIFDVTAGTKQRLFFMKPGERRNAIGTYSAGNAAVKIKYVGDLDTTAHEIGHSLDDHFGVLADLQHNSNPIIESELKTFYNNGGSKPPKGHPDPKKYLRAEGFAEFIRGLVVNPALTKQLAPNLYERYEKKVLPEFRQAIEMFSDDVRTFHGAKGSDMILANMEWDPKTKDGWLAKLFAGSEKNNEFSVTFADKINANLLNPFAAFNKSISYLKGVKGIDDLLPANNPEILARAFLHVGAKTDSIITDGMISSDLKRLKDADGNEKNIDWLMAPLDKSDETTLTRELQETSAYMIAERTLELAKRFDRKEILTGIGGGLITDVDAATKMMDEFSSYPQEKQDRIKEAANRYRELSDDVLKYMVDKGRLNSEAYQQIKKDNLFYVGLQRIYETESGNEIIPFSSGKSSSLGSVKNVIQKIKGGTQTIGNVYVNLFDTLNKAVREADRNEVLLTFRELMTENRGLYQGDQLRLSDIGVKASQGDANTITIFVDGKPEYWKFQEDIYKALKGITEASKSLPFILTALPKLLRWTVVHSPIFAARNIVRDMQDRVIKSNSNSFKNVMGLKDFVGDSKHWQDVAIAGGLNSGYYMKDRASYYGMMGEAMARLAEDKSTILLDPSKILKLGWGRFENLLEKGEGFGRVAEYRAALKKAQEMGMDEYNSMLYAGNKAADLLDFALMGHWMKVINQLVPFSNAAVQGLRSSLARAKENPVGFITRMALVTIIPQATLWLLNHNGKDDDEYESLPDYQRDMFWNLKIGDNLWISIPKAYELGVMASGVDRMMSHSYGNKKAFDGYGGSVAKSVFPVDVSDMLGPYKSIAENLTNYDFFRNKHIISPDDENTDLRLRRTDRASEVSKWLSGLAGITGIEEDPRYIDHFIKSTASYYGNFAVKASNIGREDGEKFGVSDLGFFKESPGYNSKPVQQLLDVISRFKLEKTAEAFELRRLLSASYDAKTDEEKDKASKALREYASMVVEEVRLKGMEKISQAQK